jgi:hypothetical protein
MNSMSLAQAFRKVKPIAVDSVDNYRYNAPDACKWLAIIFGGRVLCSSGCRSLPKVRL